MAAARAQPAWRWPAHRACRSRSRLKCRRCAFRSRPSRCCWHPAGVLVAVRVLIRQRQQLFRRRHVFPVGPSRADLPCDDPSTQHRTHRDVGDADPGGHGCSWVEDGGGRIGRGHGIRKTQGPQVGVQAVRAVQQRSSPRPEMADNSGSAEGKDGAPRSARCRRGTRRSSLVCSSWRRPALRVRRARLRWRPAGVLKGRRARSPRMPCASGRRHACRMLRAAGGPDRSCDLLRGAGRRRRGGAVEQPISGDGRALRRRTPASPFGSP